MDIETEVSFESILFKDTKILILGSFPSVKSFENNFYYADSRNQFWKIMEKLTAFPINNRDQKLWLLKEAKIGLWDMIKSHNKENVLESSLEDEEVNDIASLLENNPNIQCVALIGRKAEALFKLHFACMDVKIVYLSSSFSSYSKMSFEEKVIQYKKRLGF